MAVSGVNIPDKAAVGAAKFQRIIEDVFQLHIPAALLQGIWPFPNDFDACQLQIPNGNISRIAGRNDNIPLAEHIVAARCTALCRSRRP